MTRPLHDIAYEISKDWSNISHYAKPYLNAYGITEDDVLCATQCLANEDAPKLTGERRVVKLLMSGFPETKAVKIVTYIARSNPLCLIQPNNSSLA